MAWWKAYPWGQSPITRRAVEHVLDDRKDLWTPLTRVLYDLCEKHPDHNRNAEIAAKVLLIGRSHAAAVERGVRNEPGAIRDTTRFYRHRIATPIRRSGIDVHIAKLRDIGTISPENAATVLAAHVRLTDVIASSINFRKRSFISKYLHFHAPLAVPIYDSLAAAALRRYVVGRVTVPAHWKAYDREYTLFVIRYLHLHELIRERFGHSLGPRQMDRLLWKRYEKPSSG